MRTTIRMDDALLREAKQHAARTGTSLTRVIEEAVRELLARRRAGGAGRGGRVRERPRLPTFRGNGLRPGVDLDDTASLVDVMEGRDASG